MQIQSNVEIQKNQLVGMFKAGFDVRTFDVREFDKLLYETITKNALGCLGRDFIHLIDTCFYSSQEVRRWSFMLKFDEIWNVYKKMDSYVNRYDENSDVLILLSKQLKKISEKNKKYGDPFNNELIRQVYLSNCNEIINIFKEHFPVPPVTLFHPMDAPAIISKQDEDKKIGLSNFFKKVNVPDVEKRIMFIQRHIRAKIREESEIERISRRYPLSRKEAIKVIKEANTPYLPKNCTEALATRLVNAAKQVKLFSTASSLVSTDRLPKILDCMYGRKNLIDSYINFRPAALTENDIDDGDFNVICFGPNKIDPKCLKERTTKLFLDLKLLLNQKDYNKNPTIFFKQRDFGYTPDQIHRVNFGPVANGSKYIDISLTKSLRCESHRCINLQICDQHGNMTHCAELPKYLFISYNLQDMQQILTLNFFRFLDRLRWGNGKQAKDTTNEIYEEISKLDEAELINFLTDLGKAMSYTSEFNFYGAHKIDLDTLTEVEIYDYSEKQYSIKIKDLIEQLNNGNEEALDKLIEKAPEILKSKRFLNYLEFKLNNRSLLDRFYSALS